MEKPKKLSIKDVTVPMLVELKNKIEFGVSYFLINPSNELALTTNHMFRNGAGVYLNYNPNGIDRTLYGNETDFIMNMREFNNAIENKGKTK